MINIKEKPMKRIYEPRFESSDPFVREYYNPEYVNCEICGKNYVLKKEYFRCHFCNKYVCMECAHHHAVFIREPRTMRVQSMRICPNCKTKTKLASEI